MTSHTGSDIVTCARSQLGVRWRHQGRSRDGRDCIGLVLYVAHTLGLSDFDTADYDRHAKDETMLLLCKQHLVQIQPWNMRAGDVAVFAFDKQRHIGIITNHVHGGLGLIHAYAINREVVEGRLDEAWRNRIVGSFRFPGVT